MLPQLARRTAALIVLLVAVAAVIVFLTVLPDHAVHSRPAILAGCLVTAAALLPLAPAVLRGRRWAHRSALLLCAVLLPYALTLSVPGRAATIGVDAVLLVALVLMRRQVH